MWRPRLAQPARTASTFSASRSPRATPPLHLERAHRRDDHRGVGVEAGLAALDVEELLGAEVDAEARLGDDDTRRARAPSGWRATELQPWAMLANGPPWTKAGLLSSVCTRFGQQRLGEERRHRAVGLEVARGDRPAVAGLADDDRAEAALEVAEVAGEAEDRHHLGGDGDVEAGLARDSRSPGRRARRRCRAAPGRSCP